MHPIGSGYELIRRQTRKRHSTEEKIRAVLAGLHGDDSIAGKKRLAGDADGVEYRDI